MVAKIDALYNAIFRRPLLNELSVVLFLEYLLMKFKTNKGITSVRGNYREARRGCMMVARAITKLKEIMILQTLKEWDKRRERIIGP